MLPDIVGDHIALNKAKNNGKEGVNLKLIAIDLDTTGRRLCDKIFQLAVFAPFGRFEQYLMPSINLNSAARKRHQVRVIRLNGRRVLKGMLLNKILKAESEESGFRKFIAWLEEHSDSASNTVIVYHEERKFIPLMILQAILKYNLLIPFRKVVLGFVNTNEMAKAMLNGSQRPYMSVRNLLGVLAKDSGHQLLTKDFIGNASVRAKLVFNVIVELCGRDVQSCHLLSVLKPHLESIQLQVEELDEGYEALQRQNSFRPLFVNYFKTTVQRVRAVKFRILLADNGLDLSTLATIWNNERIHGLINTLEPINSLSDTEKTELVALLDSFLDPNKITIEPKDVGSSRRRRANNYKNNKQQLLNDNSSTLNMEHVQILKHNRNDMDKENNFENIFADCNENRIPRCMKLSRNNNNWNTEQSLKEHNTPEIISTTAAASMPSLSAHCPLSSVKVNGGQVCGMRWLRHH